MTQTSSLPAPVENDAAQGITTSTSISISTSGATSGTTSTSTLEIPAQVMNLGPKKVDSRDALIGVAVLVVLALIFFVIKNAYANWRVRERVAPSRANASGWFLFLGLLLVSAMAVLAVINSGQFLTPLYLAPLAGVAGVSLVAWLMTFSAKR